MIAGDNFNKILEYFEKFNYFFITVLAVIIIWYIYRHKTRKHATH
jgi:hypothetical protein